MTTDMALGTAGGRIWQRDMESLAAVGEASRMAARMRGVFEVGALEIAAAHANKCLRAGDTGGFDGWNRVCAMLYAGATRN